MIRVPSNRTIALVFLLLSVAAFACAIDRLNLYVLVMATPCLVLSAQVYAGEAVK